MPNHSNGGDTGTVDQSIQLRNDSIRYRVPSPEKTLGDHTVCGSSTQGSRREGIVERPQPLSNGSHTAKSDNSGIVDGVRCDEASNTAYPDANPGSFSTMRKFLAGGSKNLL